MYAVIKAGGKQHKVKAGDVLEVELVHGGEEEAVTFTPLLVVDDDGKTHVGKELGKATVKAKLVGEQKGEKVKVFKYRNKTGYARHTGHRQMYTLVEIGEIKLPGQPAAKKAADGGQRPAEAESEGPEPKSSAKPAASKGLATKTAAAAEPDTEPDAAEPGDPETETEAEAEAGE